MRGGVEIGRNLKIAVIAAFCVIALDAATKAAITHLMPPGMVIPVVPGLFNLVYLMNPGAAFGIFADRGAGRTLLLIAASVAAIVIIAVLIKQSKDPLMTLGLALVAGGAAGNLIDRVRLGSVVDFLDFYVNGYHWPAFNVADSAITVGVFMALVSHWFRGSGG